MKFLIANTFQKALQQLESKESSEAKLAKQAAFEFQMNPAQPGFSFERVTKSKDPNFWSLRVNDNIRIIVHRAADMVTLCYVNRHDQAYEWAERRRFEVHPETGAAQIVEIRETVREITKVIERQIDPPLFSKFEPDYLFALGVPGEWLDAVRQISEANFDALIGHLPDEAVERLLELAAGKPVPRPAAKSDGHRYHRSSSSGRAASLPCDRQPAGVAAGPGFSLESVDRLSAPHSTIRGRTVVFRAGPDYGFSRDREVCGRDPSRRPARSRKPERKSSDHHFFKDTGHATCAECRHSPWASRCPATD